LALRKFEPASKSGQVKGFQADRFGVVRAPVLPASTLGDLASADSSTLADLVRVQLRDRYTREALYLASHSLYERICAWEKGEGDFNNLPQTIARYILRMAFRATPFGTFSFVSTFGTHPGPTRIGVPDRSEMDRLVEIDSSLLGRLGRAAQTDEALKATLKFFPNDTIHSTDDGISFIAYSWDGRGKRIYRRVEVERSSYLDFVLNQASTGCTIGELAGLCADEFGNEAEPAEIAQFLSELVGDQVLCCDHIVDITSQDALAHMQACVGGSEQFTEKLSALQQARDLLQGRQALSIPEDYSSLMDVLVSAAGANRSDRSVIKVDLFDKGGSENAVSEAVLRDVEKVVNAFATLERRPGPLGKFIQRFTERFGDSEVPLLVVISELESLGYSDKDAASPPLARLVGRPSPKIGSSVSLGDSVLELALRAGTEGAKYLDISEHLAAAQKKAAKATPQKVTVVSWLSLWHDEATSKSVVEVRSVGSQDPGRVMGRFARGLPAITDYLRDSAKLVDELVCEIVHLPEDKLGNICTRPVTADYELRIRSGVSSEAKGINLADLQVSVSGDRVKLRSESLDRFIDLRMSNAHAFDRATNLPLYRFLNHVSVQCPSIELPNLRRRAPNAAFVPGLRANGIILARPTWKLSRERINALKDLDAEARRENVTALRIELGLPEWVALVQGDNIIPYCLGTPWMVDDLVKNLLREGQATLTDVFPEGMRPALSRDGTPHFHELQVALRSSDGIPPRQQHKATSFRESVAPLWDAWAYLKLYTPSHCQNAVLRRLQPILEGLVEQGLVESFFFIRYQDEGGSHLRLRLHRPAGDAIAVVLPALKSTLAGLDADRLVQSTMIQPYIREVARYGGVGVSEICEKIFCADSRLILQFVSLELPEDPGSWRSAAVAIDAMLESFGLETTQRKFDFARRAAKDFDAEMGFDKNQRSRIGEIYRKTPPLFEKGVIDPRIGGVQVFQGAIPDIASLWREAEVALGTPSSSGTGVYGIQWSLIHMRLNRFFVRDARLQEAIVWELLKRSYAREIFGNREADDA
jgi:thiopeptide-type bacteriocin biosynthesis protein